MPGSPLMRNTSPQYNPLSRMFTIAHNIAPGIQEETVEFFVRASDTKKKKKKKNTLPFRRTGPGQLLHVHIQCVLTRQAWIPCMSAYRFLYIHTHMYFVYMYTYCAYIHIYLSVWSVRDAGGLGFFTGFPTRLCLALAQAYPVSWSSRQYARPAA